MTFLNCSLTGSGVVSSIFAWNRTIWLKSVSLLARSPVMKSRFEPRVSLCSCPRAWPGATDPDTNPPSISSGRPWPVAPPPAASMSTARRLASR